jgi:hypothetical protein
MYSNGQPETSADIDESKISFLEKLNKAKENISSKTCQEIFKPEEY